MAHFMLICTLYVLGAINKMTNDTSTIPNEIETFEELKKYFPAAYSFLEDDYCEAFNNSENKGKYKTATQIVQDYANENKLYLKSPKEFSEILKDLQKIRSMEFVPTGFLMGLSNRWLETDEDAKEWLDEIINQMEKEINQRGWKQPA